MAICVLILILLSNLQFVLFAAMGFWRKGSSVTTETKLAARNAKLLTAMLVTENLEEDPSA